MCTGKQTGSHSSCLPEKEQKKAVHVYPFLLNCILSLIGSEKVYHATDSDEAYLRQINQLAPVGARLELRIGAQVMLAKNVNVQEGLVNGARGVVVGFEKGNEGKFYILLALDTVIIRH